MLERTTHVTGSAVEAEHRLRDALRIARIEAAERTGVVVDLHDAEVARLELLNEALDPIFADIPPDVDLFDRGISRGETPQHKVAAVGVPSASGAVGWKYDAAAYNLYAIEGEAGRWRCEMIMRGLDRDGTRIVERKRAMLMGRK